MASARRSVSQETSASNWSNWSVEDSEGESSAHKRRRFELLRREHYDMRQALAKCAALGCNFLGTWSSPISSTISGPR